MANPLAGAAAQYAALKYGGAVTHSVAVKSVGTSAEIVLPPNPDRLGVILVNLSANLMYVGYDGNVSATRGIFLAANGGSFVSQVDTDLTLVTLPIWVASAGAASDLFVVDVRRFAPLSEGAA